MPDHSGNDTGQPKVLKKMFIMFTPCSSTSSLMRQPTSLDNSLIVRTQHPASALHMATNLQ